MAAPGDAPPDEVEASAPGKVILSGEHSVVYTKPAVAASIALRTQVAVSSKRAGGKLSIELPDVGLDEAFELAALADMIKAPADDMAAVFKAAGVAKDEGDSKRLAAVAFLHLYREIVCRPTGEAKALAVKVVSKLPVGAGLGSSAAFNVALSAALLQISGQIPAQERWADGDGVKEKINKWAYEGERVIHGNPSGVDNTVSVYGGAIRYIKGGELKKLNTTLPILLVNTKVPRSTKALVAGVRSRRDNFPSVMDPLLDSMGALSSEFERVLHELHAEKADNGGCRPETVANLNTLVDLNHHMLNAIGVGHAALDEVCSMAVAHGLHSKLTGAGGGGCAFVVGDPLVDDQLKVFEAVHKALDARGFDQWSTTAGGEGVTGGAQWPHDFA